jgi:hypothetical protein
LGEKGGLEIEAGWEIKGVQGTWAAKTSWNWVGSVEASTMPSDKAVGWVSGSVAVGEGVPSKAPVAEAVMHVAPAPAVPRAGLVVRVGEAPVPEVVVPAAAVVAVGAGKGLA